MREIAARPVYYTTRSLYKSNSFRALSILRDLTLFLLSSLLVPVPAAKRASADKSSFGGVSVYTPFADVATANIIKISLLLTENLLRMIGDREEGKRRT